MTNGNIIVQKSLELNRNFPKLEVRQDVQGLLVNSVGVCRVDGEICGDGVIVKLIPNSYCLENTATTIKNPFAENCAKCKRFKER